MTRRGVLVGAAAIAGATALLQLLPSRRQTIAAGHLVFDERLIQTPHFAGRAAGLHTHTVSALQDLCNRWYTQLRRQVLSDGAPVAGLTTWMDHVIMRDCAAELAQLKQGGEIPDAQQLNAARESRARGWSLIRRAWLNGEDVDAESRTFDAARALPEAFEAGLEDLRDHYFSKPNLGSYIVPSISHTWTTALTFYTTTVDDTPLPTWMNQIVNEELPTHVDP